MVSVKTWWTQLSTFEGNFSFYLVWTTYPWYVDGSFACPPEHIVALSSASTATNNDLSSPPMIALNPNI